MKRAGKANRFGLLFLILLCLAGVGGLAAYVQYSSPTIGPDERIQPNQDQGKVVKVPVPIVDERANLELGNTEGIVGQSESVYLAAVNGFLSKQDSQTTLKADSIELDNRVARVHFREGFTTNIGSRDEATFLLGLRAALGQFPEVESVELYVEGQKIDELGHISLDIPMPVIRPENWKNPTKSGTGQAPPTQH
jgi:hypothetical protein